MGWFSRKPRELEKPASSWKYPRSKVHPPAALPRVGNCPECEAKGFKLFRQGHTYITSCDQCGGKNLTIWTFEDSPRYHHSYSFCPDCLYSDHTRCPNTVTCYIGSAEMAEKMLADELQNSPYPTLEQTSSRSKTPTPKHPPAPTPVPQG